MNEPKYKNLCVNPLWVFLGHDKNNDFYYCKENTTFYRVFGMGREEFNHSNARYKPWATIPEYECAYQLAIKKGLMMLQPRHENSVIEKNWQFLGYYENQDLYYNKSVNSLYRVHGSNKSDWDWATAEDVFADPNDEDYKRFPVYVRAYQLAVEQGLIAPKAVPSVTFEQMEQAKSLVNGLNIDQVIELVEKIHREGVDNFLNALKCLKKLQM